MTVCLTQAEKRHRTSHNSGYTPLFIIDPTKNRLLQYEQLRPGSQEHSVGLDPELLSAQELDVRTDLQDSGVDILSPDVLALFSDYFEHVSLLIPVIACTLSPGSNSQSSTLDLGV
jgi:translation initiation factor eIF-2B subunit epsilon